jgi:putative membrane protein
MQLLSNLLIALVAIQHLFFLWLEMFAWTTLGKKAFKGAMPSEMFDATKAMAANQGLYNGFLAAGLLWSLFIGDPNWSMRVAAFFLCCVVTAGLYGGYSVSKRIILLQAIPAAVALGVLMLS